METLQIIIAEDDNWYSEFLEYHLTLTHTHSIRKVKTASALFDQLKFKPDVITLDYNLPDLKGDYVLKRIKMECPDTEVILISGQNDIDTALQLIHNGASDYIVKNDDAKNRINGALANLLERRKLKTRIEVLEDEVCLKYDLSKSIIGNSKVIQSVYKYIDKAISSSINVSITGETGTGKEVVAKAIHYNSKRRKEPFVAVNLSAIPETLIESELFGYEKGAFTGADKTRIGKFEQAKGGTIFLDEIGEISLSTQVKILRVLQEREVTRLGSNITKTVQCRIICATNKDLAVLVNRGEFREDFYYRLIGLPIHLPKLCDRDNDVVLLANYFTALYCKQNELEEVILSQKALEKLLSYKFPGNVRELKSIIDLACVMCDEGVINPKDIIYNTARSLDDLLYSDLTLKEINEKIILRLLENNNNNILKVSDKLNIGKSTIYRLLKELNLESELN
jgi:two-component system response regulator AtoC